ncbi:hypothetical protein SAMN05444392_11915 [Seinonella peptonophila]|uniref:Uncharacterized protein n=1 Tax=Seinonella peptonophila TaxID=112248 RepID=A0A1M5B7D2_9BACL|nr:hypothetical protein [Seinonella peptonophila]SHF38389.1 hypothetical protein SAMN05444392_11915 [Seinonella peptonophila]
MSTQDNAITLTSSKEVGNGIVLNNYQRNNNTSFYERISLSGKHEFGGYRVRLSDIEQVEQMRGETIEKENLSVVIEEEGSLSRTENGNLQDERGKRATLSYEEFTQFDADRESGISHNKALQLHEERETKKINHRNLLESLGREIDVEKGEYGESTVIDPIAHDQALKLFTQKGGKPDWDDILRSTERGMEEGNEDKEK